MNIKLAEQFTRTRNGLAESFVFYRWECLPHGHDTLYLELEGCESPPQFKSGPRKGWPNYSRGTGRKTLILTMDAYSRDLEEWQRQTGLCERCMGDKREVASICLVKGTTYRQCGKCRGTGKGGAK